MPRRSKGEGTLYQAKDKSWVYQYRVDGQRKTKRFQRKADAKAFIDALTAAGPTVPAYQAVTPAQRQTAAVSEIMTLGEWMDRWLENYARPAIKHSTYCSYELYVRAHIKPQIGGLYMNTLRADDLQGFFNERGKNGNLTKKGGLAPKTLTNMRNMMHMAFGQAVKNHLLVENLIESVRLSKAPKSEMRVLSREEQRRLMTAARLAPEPAAFGIVFDLFTGLRLGELCGLRWENVDMENRSFLICETRNRLPNHDDSIAASTTVQTVATTKTDNSRRRVFIMDELFHDFELYRSIEASADSYVFLRLPPQLGNLLVHLDLLRSDFAVTLFQPQGLAHHDFGFLPDDRQNGIKQVILWYVSNIAGAGSLTAPIVGNATVKIFGTSLPMKVFPTMTTEYTSTQNIRCIGLFPVLRVFCRRLFSDSLGLCEYLPADQRLMGIAYHDPVLRLGNNLLMPDIGMLTLDHIAGINFIRENLTNSPGLPLAAASQLVVIAEQAA